MIARFVKSNNTLDLESGAYSLGEDFVPPAAAFAHDFAGGTSANVMQGANLSGYQAQNRSLNFNVRILATNEGEVNASARRLSAFLAQYLDTSEPLYFEFQPLNLPEPMWGQIGAALRYEVVTASAQLRGDLFGSSRARQQGAVAQVSLTVKPFALGRKQRLASALGGVIEERLGSVDGQPRGLRVMEATTNKITRPVFQQYVGIVSYPWQWHVGVISTIIEDPVYEGTYIAQRITGVSSTDNIFHLAFAAGNTNKHSFSAIVHRPDGAAVTSADCQLYYNAALTTSFLALGNGLYLAYADNVTGIAAMTDVALLVKLNRTVDLLAFQAEEKAYHTPITHGNLLGSDWTGAIYNSNTTRAAGRVRLPISPDMSADTINLGSWAIHIPWTVDYPSTQAGDRYLFSFSSTTIRGYYNATDDKFYLTDGVNTISSAAQAFSAGDTLDLLFCAGPSGLAIYKNGASIASGATYSPPTANDMPTYIYFGTDDSATNHAGGIIQPEIYPRELTSAEVLAIYNAINPALAAGRGVSQTPVFWTKDGDDTVDSCDDSTRDNWGVALGIPGDYDASTEWWVATDDRANYGFWLLNSPLDTFVLPSRQWVIEASGTADADASGGASTQFAAGSGAITYTYPDNRLGSSGRYAINGDPDLFTETTLHCFVRAKHAVADGYYAFKDLDISVGAFYGGVIMGHGDGAVMHLLTNYGLHYLGEVSVPAKKIMSGTMYFIPGTNIGLGTSGTLSIDYFMLIPGDALKILLASNASSWFNYFHITETETIATDSYGSMTYAANTLGKHPNLKPGQYNTVFWHSGTEADSDNIAATTVFEIYVTPRWSLI